MAIDPYARTRAALFWFMAAVVAAVGLAALALVAWMLRAIVA